MLRIEDIETMLNHIVKERLRIARMVNKTQSLIEYDTHLARLQQAYEVEQRKAEKRKRDKKPEWWERHVDNHFGYKGERI